MEDDELIKKLSELVITTVPSDSRTKTINVGFFSVGTAGKTCIINRFPSGEFVEQPERTIHDAVIRTEVFNEEPIQFIIEEVGCPSVYKQLLDGMLSRVHIAVLCCRPARNQTEADMWQLVQDTRESLLGRTVVFALTHKDIDNPTYKYKDFSEAYLTFNVSAKTGEGLDELWKFIAAHAREQYNPNYKKEKK